MGNFNRNNPGFRKRESSSRKPETQINSRHFFHKTSWWLAIIIALLFFFSSFEGEIGADLLFEEVWQSVLILLALLMVVIALLDKKERVVQRKKRERLLKILEKQKETLKNHFAFQKGLLMGRRKSTIEEKQSQSSLNFAVDLENILEKRKIREQKADSTSLSEEKSFDAKGPDTPGKRNYFQGNLAKTLIEGEDISSFPPEWQEFFVENEEKEPIEKLNKMLGNKNNK